MRMCIKEDKTRRGGETDHHPAYLSVPYKKLRKHKKEQDQLCSSLLKDLGIFSKKVSDSLIAIENMIMSLVDDSGKLTGKEIIMFSMAINESETLPIQTVVWVWVNDSSDGVSISDDGNLVVTALEDNRNKGEILHFQWLIEELDETLCGIQVKWHNKFLKAGSILQVPDVTAAQVLILHEILDKLLTEQVAAYKGFQFSDLREFTKGLNSATFGITDVSRSCILVYF
ncbi:hypothetical protein Bca52824_033222 [Brassica carinata]|uniref:Uncharacterized protein n=1 Tax=Brassica carinata TaxID=52824 RepID=A0A8X7SDU0_BRACI|nr:hypothetical protein Bca52824_033222 [Brassica carinata]